MEFNLGAIIIGIISLLALIFPFVLDYRNRKKKENNLLEPLKRFAQQQNGQINDYEVCENFIIGIDKARNSVFFYKEEKDNVISQFIDLNDIQTCKVITSQKTMSNSKIVDKLELNFMDKNQAKQTINIYTADGISRLNGEIQLANKWSELINKQLNNSLVAEHV